MREYELAYVIGTERDVIGLRTNIWRDPVSLYPIRATPETMRRAFVDMTQRAESLARKPEFYNTLTNSCISNIVRHVNTVTPHKIRLSASSILPGYSDRLAYDLGLIDTTLPFEKIRGAYAIRDAALRHGLGDGYSEAIRAGLPWQSPAH